MKKLLSVLILTTMLGTGTITPANAGYIANKKAQIEKNVAFKNDVKEIRTIMEKQIQCINKYDLKGLSAMYSKDFINSDGFNKDTYFKLIQETWTTYPNISYSSVIKNIEFNDNYASVLVEEKAIATTEEDIGTAEAAGELYSTSECIYYLERVGSKWLVSAEKILKETSSLKYGDARFVNIDLVAPQQIGAGKSYTSKLLIDAPYNSVVFASIGKEKIVNPQSKADEVFRKLPDDNILERMFTSNADNINEYNVASVGITKSEIYDKTKVKVFMGGLAFVMTRVNVIPENKFVKIEDNDIKKNEVKDNDIKDNDAQNQ